MAQGINTYIRELYKSLIPIANDITFIFAAQDVDRIKAIFGNSVNIRYLKLGQHSKYYRLAFEYPKIIKDNSVDWAHFQYTMPIVKNCKTIVTLHDILFEDFPGEFPIGYRLSKHVLFKISARRADMLLTVSGYSRKRIAHVYGIPESHIYVTPNGVSEEYKSLDKELAKEYIENSYGINHYILYVSRFEPRKNQQALLKAFRNLRLYKHYHLVFIGVESLKCAEFDEELSMCDEDVKSKIHILNNVPYLELKQWYAGADLFVYPSKAEGFGIPPLEAGACGVPVISNNATAMKDFTFFSPRHISTDNQGLLEKSIQLTLNDYPTKIELQRVQERIYEKYSWSLIASGFYSHLQKYL